jgi:hypothetical protein
VFDRIAAESIQKTYQAKYDVEISSSGINQKGTAVFANKSPKFASTIKLNTAGVEFAITIINDGKDTYFCNDIGAGGSCSKDSSLGQAAGVDVKKAVEEARKGNDVKELEKRTIAGRAARCFETKDPNTGSVSSFCLDEKDSITLFFNIGGVTKMTATEVTSNVDDKLFELPFPVK